jgi:tetratricopeptide (TPR) repeat protein
VGLGPADQEIARAIELNPSFAEAYHFRSKMDTALGRNEEAIEAEKKSQELDPFERPFAMRMPTPWCASTAMSATGPSSNGLARPDLLNFRA